MEPSIELKNQFEIELLQQLATLQFFNIKFENTDILHLTESNYFVFNKNETYKLCKSSARFVVNSYTKYMTEHIIDSYFNIGCRNHEIPTGIGSINDKIILVSPDLYYKYSYNDYDVIELKYLKPNSCYVIDRMTLIIPKPIIEIEKIGDVEYLKTTIRKMPMLRSYETTYKL